MAVATPQVSLILELLERAVDRILGLQSAQQAEAEFQTLLSLGNGILDQVRQANLKLDQLLHRVAANQTQSATNALTLATISRDVQAVPSETASSVWDVTDNLSQQLTPPTFRLAMHWLINFLHSVNDNWALFSDVGNFYVLNLGVATFGDTSRQDTLTPSWDWSQVQANDTLLSFVARLNPNYNVSWGTAPFGNVFLSPKDSTPGIVNFYTSLDDPTFQILKTQFLNGGISPLTAPVWPGLAHVTLGTPVAIAPIAQTVNGPLDGVIVSITGGFQNLPHYKLGAVDSYKAIGTVTFTTDNGQAEVFQLLGPTQAVVCPREMARAQTAEFRWLPGITGTITPWTRS